MGTLAQIPGIRSRGVEMRDHLLKEMAENRIPIGGQLPTESELMRRFSLGRSTVRTVLLRMCVEGLVNRHRGRGTFRIAGRPSQRRAWLVGVWFNWPHGPLFGPIAQGIREELVRHGYHCLIERGGLDRGDECRGIESLLNKGLDGFIVAPSSNPHDDHRPLIELIRQQRPLVLVDRALPGYRADLVTTHSELGSAEIVEHLIELGHRRIGFIGIEGLSTVDERLQGYRDTMTRSLLPVDPAWIGVSPRLTDVNGNREDEVVVDSGGTRLSVTRCRSAVERVLSLPPEKRPTALFCVNDAIADLAVRVIGESGLRVPRDLSVAGFDDVNLENSADAAGITTYAQPSYRIGQQAARLMTEQIEGRKSHTTTILLAGKLVRRSSTAPPLNVELRAPLRR